MSRRILITGAAGYLGSLLGNRLAQDYFVMGTDIRARDDLTFSIEIMDIRDPAIADLIKKNQITHVVHLASVLESKGDRALEYDIDVNGTRNLLQACVEAGVRHLTVTSSGAAYGYHADNPEWIDEDQPLRGNREFPYADHKRQIETLLEECRQQNPSMQQLIFRPGTILGAQTRNLITNLFSAKRLIAIRGSESPFVFIWDRDVVSAMAQGIECDATGIFNMAGDGAVGIYELASLLGKPVIAWPAWLLQTVLWLGKRLGVGRYGPEQINFLRYRPVLSNRRLKNVFGYRPEKSSRETFLYWLDHARKRGDL